MWEALYKTYYPELLRYAAASCHDAEQAEDFVQDVFLKALQNTDVLASLGPHQRRAWLYRTLKNRMIDHFRRDTLESDSSEPLLAEGTEEPGFAALENTLLLQRLPQPDQPLVRLRYLEGYTAQELSDMFCLPVGTIRSKLSRSKKILRQYLAEKI